MKIGTLLGTQFLNEIETTSLRSTRKSTSSTICDVLSRAFYRMHYVEHFLHNENSKSAGCLSILKMFPPQLPVGFIRKCLASCDILLRQNWSREASRSVMRSRRPLLYRGQGHSLFAVIRYPPLMRSMPYSKICSLIIMFACMSVTSCGFMGYIDLIAIILNWRC